MNQCESRISGIFLSKIQSMVSCERASKDAPRFLLGSAVSLNLDQFTANDRLFGGVI